MSHLLAVYLSESVKWKTCLKHRDSNSAHHIQEEKAYRALCKRSPTHSQFVIGQASRDTIGAFATGCSPSAALHKGMVTTMTEIIGRNLQPAILHFPTWSIRADAPSRTRQVAEPRAPLPSWLLELRCHQHPSEIRGLEETSGTTRALAPVSCSSSI